MVVYGDAPLLSASAIRQLIDATQPPASHAALLSISLSNPPAAGRIVRDDEGAFVDIVEVPDCTPTQLAIEEINVGVYCFDAVELTRALQELSPDNAQNEYYLTDVPGEIQRAGHLVEVVVTEDVLETLGVNDRHHLAFAESVEDIRHAESLYPLIDAVCQMALIVE